MIRQDLIFSGYAFLGINIVGFDQSGYFKSHPEDRTLFKPDPGLIGFAFQTIHAAVLFERSFS
jgi:hypothetical protein